MMIASASKCPLIGIFSRAGDTLQKQGVPATLGVETHETPAKLAGGGCSVFDPRRLPGGEEAGITGAFVLAAADRDTGWPTVGRTACGGRPSAAGVSRRSGGGGL
jgi:hypothetical protein